jgi:uncharacterized membrane protein YedE/YeeE
MFGLLFAVCSGVVFGVGLAFSGMLNPQKVAGFLDLFGVWDPSLMFVMAGGILINAAGHFLFVRKGKPLFAAEFSLPEARNIDRKLVIGSVLFGIGWGLAGLCPGPVIASIALDPMTILPFLGVMLVGLKLGRILSGYL